MDKIKVAIVDEDLEWIKHIIDFLHKENDIIVLWSATSKATAKSHAKGEDVDIMLIENTPQEDNENSSGNLAVIREIAEISKAKIISMGSTFQEELIKNSIFAGAVNYVLKQDFEIVPFLIRLTYKQISPVEVLLKDYRKIKTELELSGLTLTEKELYMLKKQGCSILQIAIKTNKSEGTVRNQLCKVYKKLKSKA